MTTPVHLSTPAEARLPRSWIALLRGRIHASLAATTGVENTEDIVTYLLAGADVVMTTSALLRHDPEHADTLLEGLTGWMARKEFTAVGELRGLLRVPDEPDPSDSRRAGYPTAVREATHLYGDRWIPR